MRISRNWLNDFVDILDLTPEAFSEIITTKVAEVDAIEHTAIPLGQAMVAEIAAIERHPTKEKLSLATVAVAGEKITLVSGAPNLRVGMRSPFIAPGSQVYAGGSLITVEQREVAGVMSPGVLASEAELGLTADHSGVMALDDSARVGQKLVELFEGPDYVLVIDNKSLTHRPDLWCHFGFARELSAILGRPLKQSPDRFSDDGAEGAAVIAALGSGKGPIATAIADGSGCRRFMGVMIEGVTIGRSPLWLRRRLFSAEIGSKNTIVDLSNYVMLDVGQPNHTYDADRLRGETIRARRAQPGEQFLGLDDVSRSLDEQDMVIADSSGPVALAGIIGGGPSAISDGTTRLFLESANFDPTLVRKSSKRHQTRTDASNRFEKCPSVFGAAVGLGRFIELLTSLDKGARVVGSVSDAFPSRPSRVVIPTTFSYIKRRIGAELDQSVMSNILTGLGFKITETKRGDVVEVAVPYWRASKDVTEPQDLVEEVGRIYGYERVPETVPLVSAAVPERDPLRELEHRVRDALVAEGFSETYGYSTVAGIEMEKLGYDLSTAFTLENPVDAEEAHLRLTLLPGMLRSLALNAKRFPEMALFELGRTYQKNPKVPGAGKQGEVPALEDRRLCLGFSAAQGDERLSESLIPPLRTGGSFFVLTGIIRALCRAVSLAPVRFVPFSELSASQRESLSFTSRDFAALHRWMHPYRSAAVVVGNAVVGNIAELHPALDNDIPAHTICAELSMPGLLAAAAPVELFTPVAKYPESLFELSIVAKKNEPYAAIEKVLDAAVPSEQRRGLEVIAVYEGAPLAADEKSVSVRFRFGAADRTLSSAEIKELEQRVMNAVEQGSYGIRR